MNADKVRRFDVVEVAFHAIQALLYLTLFTTGGLLLLQRLLEHEWMPHQFLVPVHRIVGIILVFFLLQTIAISIVSPAFRTLWTTLQEALKWHRPDIVWLAKMPLHAVFHRVSLPPAARLNPGQKLHLLTIVTVLIGFSLSGLLMMLIPGALAPWIIHLACFIPALFFLILHLFLSLINPPTRKALTGMITGYVPRQYAQEHHSLWQKSTPADHNTIHISRRAIIITACVAAILLVSLYRYGGIQRITKRIPHIIDNRGVSAITPATLSDAHGDPNTIQCLSCHNFWSTPSKKNCLECHREIQQRIADQSGYHGTFTAPCTTCHREHLGQDADIRPLDQETFNHNLARLMLRGKHRPLPCRQCHMKKNDLPDSEQLTYIGIAKECLDCHTDPHQGQFQKDCSQCHNEQGWTEQVLAFSHNESTQFDLDAIHAELDCAACHRGADNVLYPPTPKTCSKCHADIANYLEGRTAFVGVSPDPHFGRVTCEDCHLTDQPDQSAAEYAQRCVNCHNEHYRDLFYDWSKALHRRQAETEESLRVLRQENVTSIATLVEEYHIAKIVGLHNISLATRIYSDALQDSH
jgi:cytochrome b subunit of formate dehydrogenase